MNKACKVDEHGLFIGFISTPPGTSSVEDFFEKNIASDLFLRYRNSREDYIRKGRKNELEPFLYTPLAFKAIGDQDLIVLSLIDDLSFSHRVFHPYHSNISLNGRSENDKESEGFEYQVVTCSNSCVKGSRTFASLKDTFGYNPKTLEDSIVKYPFISVSKIKVSNYFLLGNGIGFLNLSKKGILQLCNKYASGTDIIKTIVLDSFGSHMLLFEKDG